MFIVHDDMTIYATRGDVVYFSVEKKVGGAKYQFQPGDIVRIKVCAKKDYSRVFLMKDFLVEAATTSVNIFLDRHEMKFGELINKPTDYWYEVELNPDTYPDTFIGHNDDGPAVFKLFPEAKDVVEGEIPGPEENSAVSRMVVTFVNEYLGDHAETIIQELLKEEYIEQIVNEILKEQNIESIIKEILTEENVEAIVKELIKQDSIDTIVQEILKTENIDTIVQEVLKQENIETIVQEVLKADNISTIVQEIIKPENIQSIVQEVLKELDMESIAQDILNSQEFKDAVQEIVNDSVNTDDIIQEVTKPENTTVIVEQVIQHVPIHLVVTMDTNSNASHSAAEIKAHLQGGGSVELAHVSYLTPVAQLRSIDEERVVFYYTKVDEGSVWEVQISVNDQKRCTVTQEVYEVKERAVSQIDFSNFDNGSFTEIVDGKAVVHTATFDSLGRPATIDDATIIWGAT